MDGHFLAGLVAGGVVGFGWAAVLFSWRKWRSTIADVPITRAVMVRNVRELLVIGGVVALAAFVALSTH